jgi:hypothetical protein
MIETEDVGRTVYCDACGEDYTDSPATGGLLHQSKAICPVCAPRWRDERDLSFIRGECPAGMPFADWVRDIVRGGMPGTIQIISGPEADQFFNPTIKQQPNPQNQ